MALYEWDLQLDVMQRLSTAIVWLNEMLLGELRKILGTSVPEDATVSNLTWNLDVNAANEAIQWLGVAAKGILLDLFNAGTYPFRPEAISSFSSNNMQWPQQRSGGNEGIADEERIRLGLGPINPPLFY